MFVSYLLRAPDGKLVDVGAVGEELYEEGVAGTEYLVIEGTSMQTYQGSHLGEIGDGGVEVRHVSVMEDLQKRKQQHENEEKNAEEETEREEGSRKEGEQGAVPPLNFCGDLRSFLDFERGSATYKRCGEFPVSVEWILSFMHFQLLLMESFHIP